MRLKPGLSLAAWVCSMASPLSGQSLQQDTALVSWVKHVGAGLSLSVDLITAVTTDPYGNIYVAGRIEGSRTSSDYLTAKYNSSGIELWSARYNSPSNGYDAPTGIAVDRNGNVLVTGTSQDSSSSFDFLTVKYNGDGNQQWTARYNGPGNAGDMPVAIALDARGNVYVTGEINTLAGGFISLQFATIKYSASGAQQWVAVCDSPANASNRPLALTVDDSANVFVAGTNWFIAETYKIFTMRYAPDGTQQWVATFGHDSLGLTPVAMVHDPFGNIIVGMKGSGRTARSIVAKYNPMGALQWAVADSSGSSSLSALVVDMAGNVLSASGSRGNATDSLVVSKLTSEGLCLFRRARSIPTPNTMSGTSILVDASGDFYVTGSCGSRGYYPSLSDSLFLIKYNADGTERWIVYRAAAEGAFISGYSAAINAVGRVAVVGGKGRQRDTDGIMMLFDQLGNELWRIEKQGGDIVSGTIHAIAVDEAGNVYATGPAKSGREDFNIITSMFDANGNQVWLARYDGPGRGVDISFALMIDGSGNVYVAGASAGVETGMDIVTLKYNAMGQESWVARRSVQATGFESGFALEIDSKDNVIVVGGDGRVVIKYNQNGVEEWIDQSAGYGPNRAVALDDQDNIIVTGQTGTRKYTIDGNLAWTAAYGGSDVVLSDEGSAFITSAGSGTVAISSVGDTQWTRPAGGTQIALADSSSLYVMHRHFPWVRKLTTSGDEIWSFTNVPINSDVSYAVDSPGNVYVTGPRLNATGFMADAVTAKISSAGVKEWESRLAPIEDSFFFPRCIAVDHWGNVFAAGETQGSDFSLLPTIVKYNQIVVSVQEDDTGLPSAFGLAQNFPNPFNPSTRIRFSLPHPTQVELKVYNTLGQQVETLVDEERNAGVHEIVWNADRLPSGVYFYRLLARGFTATKKLILLR